MGVIVSTLFLIKCYQVQNLWAACGVWLYLFGMGGSYLASTLYHPLKHHNPWKRRLRHWDHAAIYWHIAGSYSPSRLIALREDGGWGLFGFVWLCAIIGTAVSFRKMEEHSYVETVCYILMGLSVLVVFKQLFALSPTACYWIIAEGVCYITELLSTLAQGTVHASGFPFLCIGRFSLPHAGCMGHTGEDAVSKTASAQPLKRS